MVYALLSGHGVHPSPLFSQGDGLQHCLFCSLTLGLCDRPREEGSHGGGVCSFFPVKKGCGFFAYSWKLPAYSGAFSLQLTF